jgi:hypothetical protein
MATLMPKTSNDGLMTGEEIGANSGSRVQLDSDEESGDSYNGMTDLEMRVFLRYDRDGKGYLSPKEVRVVMGMCLCSLGFGHCSTVGQILKRLSQALMSFPPTDGLIHDASSSTS